MVSLKTLAADLLTLPEKERHKNLVGLLGQMQSKVDDAAKTLADAAIAATHAKELLGAKVAVSVRANQHKAAMHAGKLLRLLDDFDNVVMNGPADEAIVDIVKNATASRTTVRDQWRQKIDLLSKGYEALTVAAEQAQLPGRGKMRQAVSRFASAAAQPPSTAEASQKVLTDQDAVKAAIKELGIQGIVGDFLTAASQERGDPRHLLQQEVASFLDANPDLWNLLRVKLA
jgi:hypothetical protein